MTDDETVVWPDLLHFMTEIKPKPMENFQISEIFPVDYVHNQMCCIIELKI